MILSKKIAIYLILIGSLFVGYYFEENSSGGAKIDHEYMMPFVIEFSLDLENGLNNYFNNKSSLIHSPVFYLLASFGFSFTNSLELVNVAYIIMSSLLPLIFYKVLFEKFQKNSEFLFFLSLIIFISPYFRSSGIWLLGDNLSLIFFSLFILFLLKAEKKKNYIFLSLIFLILCCYIRYYYCLFYIYFLYMTLCKYKLNIRFNTYLFLLSLITALPAIFYLIYIILNHNFFDALTTFGGTNYISSSLIIFSIILFYLVPFFWNDFFKIIEYYKKNKISFLIIFTSFLSLYFLNNYLNLFSFSTRGGGVFIKLAKFIDFNLNIAIIILGAISIFILNYIFDMAKLRNYFIILILILSLSLNTIYQKYLDPFFIIIFFSLINSKVMSDKIEKKEINLSLVFIYFFSFYLFSLYYYS